MTKVRVWLLNEGGRGWFTYWPVFEGYCSAEDLLGVVREYVHELLPKLKEKYGWAPPAVAYEVVREKG